MIPQIPYQEIGLGVAILVGIWAFFVAETAKERALIVGIPAVILLILLFVRSSVGPLISLVGWMIFGVGCIVFLRYKGVMIRQG